MNPLDTPTRIALPRRLRLLLPAVLVAAAVPATAEAATIELGRDGRLAYQAAAAETNNVHVEPEGFGVRLKDFGARISVVGTGCRLVRAAPPAEVVCGARSADRAIDHLSVALGDGGDGYTSRHGFQAFVGGGAGDDRYFHDVPFGSGHSTRTTFGGGPGSDRASYVGATKGVVVTKDGEADDGRPFDGTFVPDRDDIGDDVELIDGSRFGDRLTGGAGAEIITGGGGDDVMTGGDGVDIFRMGSSADGRDTIVGGGGRTGGDEVDYGARRRPVVATLDHGPRGGDGEAGEGDDLAEIESVVGGSAADTLTAPRGTPLGIFALSGGAGADTLTGGALSDGLTGGSGRDRIFGGDGGDTVRARDGEPDTIDCGANAFGFDRVDRDPAEALIVGCEGS